MQARVQTHGIVDCTVDCSWCKFIMYAGVQIYFTSWKGSWVWNCCQSQCLFTAVCVSPFVLGVSITWNQDFSRMCKLLLLRPGCYGYACSLPCATKYSLGRDSILLHAWSWQAWLFHIQLLGTWPFATVTAASILVWRTQGPWIFPCWWWRSRHSCQAISCCETNILFRRYINS